MVNVTYAYYQQEFKGSAIPEVEFDKYSREAELVVNKCTYGRIHQYQLHENDLQSVMMAICAAADLQYSDVQCKLKTGGKTVKSENTDGYSVTYADPPSGMTDEQALYQKSYDVARLYLQDTTLLYPGVYYDYEC